MPIKIEFDPSYNACEPTFVLATRSGMKLGALLANDLVVKDPLNSFSEVVFCVYKELDGRPLFIWDEIVDFKLVHCVEWDMWFEIKVEIDAGNETVKNVTAVSIGEAELSQIKLYDVEINTETDISRDDYSPTILYDSDSPATSLLHRITEKAPHYKFVHVDSRLASMQRTFSFNDVSIYDAFQKIAEELHCIFIINSGSNADGAIAREISVYDLESMCKSCGHRGEFLDACPECGSTNIDTGYGEDTSIFVCTDNLADNIRYSTNTESVKNCFRLVAGDDLMTATIAGCNPNGSGYIWYLSEETKADMSEELQQKLTEYDELYDYYQNEHVVTLPSSIVAEYNKLANIYKGLCDIKQIPASITGYPSLMRNYYDTIDAHQALEHGMMPEMAIEETTADIQAGLLTASNFPAVAVQDLEICSSPTASNAVLGYAKVIVDPRYKVRVNEGVLNEDNTWTGNFTVTSYSDDADTATSQTITVTINDDVEQYTKQKLEKELADVEEDRADIAALFKMETAEFTSEIRKYCLVMLNSFRDSCQSCLDILIESGAGDPSAWEGQDPNLYEELYVPYYEKLRLLDDEIELRQNHIYAITGKIDSNGDVITPGVQTEIEREKSAIQDALDFQNFLGEDLWLEFVAYRRDDTYQNDNYISDGLDNSELFSNALEFIETAKKEVVRAANLQHSITATLKNLLVMKEFQPIVKHFQNGNWIRIQVDDAIYRLRLIEFEINYNDLDHINVEFSDVCKVADGISDIESILNQAASMATSYDAVVRQAEQGTKANGVVSEWVSKGLDLTNTKIMNSADNQDVVWDKKGMLFRRYDPVTEEYDDCQLKIINSTLAITDDNWESVKTALGRYYYVHPETGEEIMAYGIIAETIVGSLILGERLGIYSSNENLTFDENGLIVTDGNNTFQVDPSPDPDVGILFRLANKDGNVFYIDQNGRVNIDSNSLLISNDTGSMSFGKDGLLISNDSFLFAVDLSKERLLRIANAEEDVFYIDKDGVLHIAGDGSKIDISTNATIEAMDGRISAIVDGGNGDYTELTVELGKITERVTNAEGDINEIITTAEGTEQRLSDAEGNIQTIKKTADGNVTEISNIKGEIVTIKEEAGLVETRITNAEKDVSLIRQTVNEIDLSVSNEETSASIVITIGDDQKTGTIDLTGLVRFIDLSEPNEQTTICGDNIATGTLNAEKGINLYGTFTVKSSNQNWDGGKIGYMTGTSVENGQVYTTNGIGLACASQNNYLIASDGGVRMTSMETDSDGNVTASTSFYTSPLKIKASQAIDSTSDRRLKNSINYSIDAYDAFYQNLKPVSYRYNHNGTSVHTGFIAQDVQEALESSGLTPNDFAGLSMPDETDEMYALAYDEFIALNTHMIQKLMKRMDSIEKYCYQQEA